MSYHIALLNNEKTTEFNIYPDEEINSNTFRYFCAKDGKDLHFIQTGAFYFIRRVGEIRYRYMGVVSKIISEGTEKIYDKKKEEWIDVSYKDIQIEARPSFKGLEPLEVVPNRPSDIFGRKQGSFHYNRDAAYQAGIDKPIPSAMRGILYKNIDEWEIIDQLPSPKSTTELDWIDFENTI